MTAFKQYTYFVPSELPVTFDDDAMWRLNPDGMRRAQTLTDEEWQAAGFDPEVEEAGIGMLTEAWNGHPVGAIVLSGLTVEGHPFAVEQP